MRIERNLIFLVLFMAILTQFSPVMKSFLSYSLLLGLFILISLNPDFMKALKTISGIFLFLMICVVACVIPSLWLSDYVQLFTCLSFFILILLMFLHFKKGNESQNKVNQLNFIVDSVYFIFFALVLVNIYLHLDDSGAVVNIETDESFISDKNYLGVFIFLFFLYANKRKHLSGIILGWGYLMLSDSRGYLLMFGLFYLVSFFSGMLNNIIKKMRIGFFSIFVFLFIAISILSFIWVFQISTGPLDNYHESLNDASNRMRFVANLKAFQMLSDLNRTLFWGYGRDLHKALGIERNNYSKHRRFMGVRLVVSHNSLINSLIRMGIIPGTIYLYLLAQLLNKYRDKDNYAYLFPYIINALFLASLFDRFYLIFWIIVLELPVAKKYKFL